MSDDVRAWCRCATCDQWTENGTQCLSCERLAAEVVLRKAIALERRVVELESIIRALKQSIATEPTADIYPEEPEGSCAA